MSASLLVQLKKERDDAHRKTYDLKMTLESILNGLDARTGKKLKTKKEILEYIQQEISK